MLTDYDIDLEAGPPPPYSAEPGGTSQRPACETIVYGGFTETPVTVSNGHTRPYGPPSDLILTSAFVVDDTQAATGAGPSAAPATRRDSTHTGGHSGCCDDCDCACVCAGCLLCCEVAAPFVGTGLGVWRVVEAAKALHDHNQQHVNHLANDISAYSSPPNMTYGHVADTNATLSDVTLSNATISNATSVTTVSELLPTSTAIEVNSSQPTSRHDRKP